MATMQPQLADSPPAEFVLAGRSWLFVSVAVLCLVAAIYFLVTRDHPFVGLRWQMWRATGISLEERQDLYAAGFAVLALACLIWVLIGSRVARRVVITSADVRIYSTQLSPSNPIVLPFAAIRDAGQRELPSRSGRSELARSADRFFRFSVNGRDFDFRRFAFRSDRDFDRFCQLIVSRIG